jgi:hypothetical protein
MLFAIPFIFAAAFTTLSCSNTGETEEGTPRPKPKKKVQTKPLGAGAVKDLMHQIADGCSFRNSVDGWEKEDLFSQGWDQLAADTFGNFDFFYPSESLLMSKTKKYKTPEGIKGMRLFSDEFISTLRGSNVFTPSAQMIDSCLSDLWDPSDYTKEDDHASWYFNNLIKEFDKVVKYFTKNLTRSKQKDAKAELLKIRDRIDFFVFGQGFKDLNLGIDDYQKWIDQRQKISKTLKGLGLNQDYKNAPKRLPTQEELHDPFSNYWKVRNP